MRSIRMDLNKVQKQPQDRATRQPRKHIYGLYSMAFSVYTPHDVDPCFPFQ